MLTWWWCKCNSKRCFGNSSCLKWNCLQKKEKKQVIWPIYLMVPSLGSVSQVLIYQLEKCNVKSKPKRSDIRNKLPGHWSCRWFWFDSPWSSLKRRASLFPTNTSTKPLNVLFFLRSFVCLSFDLALNSLTLMQAEAHLFHRCLVGCCFSTLWIKLNQY